MSNLIRLHTVIQETIKPRDPKVKKLVLAPKFADVINTQGTVGI